MTNQMPRYLHQNHSPIASKIERIFFQYFCGFFLPFFVCSPIFSHPRLPLCLLLKQTIKGLVTHQRTMESRMEQIKPPCYRLSR